MVDVPVAKSATAISLRELFFAPETDTVPARRSAPAIRKTSTINENNACPAGKIPIGTLELDLW
jgi:hypothetical protein